MLASAARFTWILGIASLVLACAVPLFAETGGASEASDSSASAADRPQWVDGPGASKVRVVGRSAEGRALEVYRIGSGPRTVLIVGGIHGGYEWNSIVLARRVRDYYAARPERLPEQVTLLVVPVMNPDGLARVTGGTPIDQFDFSRADTIPGRFNANWVDLNRNWDGDWQPTSYWGRREVDAGSAPFSEPETQAVRDLILRTEADVVLFYQSAAAGIWYSGAPQQWLPSRRLAVAYGEASGYALPSTSDDGEGDIDYEITGSASDYLYEQRIPSLTVELSTHQVIEFDRNIAGLRALFRELRAE